MDKRLDDNEPVKCLIEWNGYTIGLQYYPLSQRHNKTIPLGYGHFRRLMGADRMALDVYVGTDLSSKEVFAVSQLVNGEFDEEKIIIGVPSAIKAKELFIQCALPEMFGGIKSIGLSGLEKYRVAGDKPEPKADSDKTGEKRIDRHFNIDEKSLIEKLKFEGQSEAYINGAIAAFTEVRLGKNDRK